MSTGSIADTADLNDDDFLLNRLAGLVNEIDPVPLGVIMDARATLSSEVSQPRRRGGAAIDPSLSGLAKLLGPSSELDSLAGGAAADVAGVTAGTRFDRTRDRARGTSASATNLDVHTA